MQILMLYYYAVCDWKQNKRDIQLRVATCYGCVQDITENNNRISFEIIINFLFLIYQRFSENRDLYNTKCILFSLKCVKSVGGWGSAPDPAGGAYSAPPGPLAVIGRDEDFVASLVGDQLCAPLLVTGAPLLI